MVYVYIIMMQSEKISALLVQVVELHMPHYNYNNNEYSQNSMIC